MMFLVIHAFSKQGKQALENDLYIINLSWNTCLIFGGPHSNCPHLSKGGFEGLALGSTVPVLQGASILVILHKGFFVTNNRV